MRVRNRLLQLKRNRLRIRRTIPAVIHRARHALRIAARESIFRFCERTHINATHRAGFPQNFLSECDWRDDLIVFTAAGGNNSTHSQGSPGKRDLIPSLRRKPRRQPLSQQNIARRIIRPRSRNFPPRVRGSHTRRKLFFTESDPLGKVSPEQGHIF